MLPLPSAEFMHACRKDTTIRGYEVWSPLLANRIVDISSTSRLKAHAVAEFASQTQQIDYARAISGLNAYRSMYFGRGRGEAEAFYECTSDAFLLLVERFGRSR